MPLQVPFSEEPEWELEEHSGNPDYSGEGINGCSWWRGKAFLEQSGSLSMIWKTPPRSLFNTSQLEGEEVPADVQDFFLQIHSERMEQEANSAES